MRHKKTESEPISKLDIRNRSPRGRYRSTVKVQDVVDAVMRKQEWADELFERTVFDIWESVVGNEIAAQSVPVMLFSGVLRVDVTHQVYINELSLMKPDILSKLENQLKDIYLRKRRFIPTNKVVDIRFRFNPNVTEEKNGEDSTKSTSNQQQSTNDIRKDAKFISPEMIEKIEASVSGISDSELRDALKTLFITLSGGMETTE